MYTRTFSIDSHPSLLLPPGGNPVIVSPVICLEIPCSSCVQAIMSDTATSSGASASNSLEIIAAAAAAASGLDDGALCCGGKLQLNAPIKLCCYGENAVGKSQAVVTTIPASADEIQSLLSICQEASFGRGSETVRDASYRSALCLNPTSFSTTFSLEQHGILHTIKTLMMPKSAGTVTAQLYKLNVYREGDFFKSHVDTPCDASMFGSLVVCLPQPHAGGELKVQGKAQAQAPAAQQVHTFDWGMDASAGTAQWAAFYSDSPHEILPVQSGHRITLTYNLLLHPASDAEPSLPGLSPSSIALHSALKAALANPDFMPMGGTLGFGCQHAYPHTHEQLYQDVPSMLKGGDAAVLAVARALGLRAEVQAVHNTQDLQDFDRDEEHLEGEEGLDLTRRLSALAPAVAMKDSDQHYNREQAEQHLFGNSTSAAHVTWCRRPSGWAMQVVNATYGNEASMRSWYSAAAVLVTMPAYELRQ